MAKSAIDIADALDWLSALTIFELRSEWRRLHRVPPPMRLSRDLLIRGIAYKLQERLHGGLSQSILRKLERLDTEAETSNVRKPAPIARTATSGAASQRGCTADSPASPVVRSHAHPPSGECSGPLSTPQPSTRGTGA